MREILFRGKRKDNGEWIEGNLFQWGNVAYILRDLAMNVKVKYEVIPKTVGQYIGTEDENGVKVFEGDIIDRFGTVYLIDFNNSSFSYRSKHDVLENLWGDPIDDSEYGIYISDYCIIGNIHDNPELMRVK